jgi:uncharacterized phage protein (TIGR02220 family)
MKLPALHFYVGDWRKSLDVQSLYHDRGVWLEMLCFMFDSEQRGKLIRKGKAIPDDDIFRLLGLDNQIGATTLTALLESGVASRDPDTGAIMSRRMVRDESLRKVRSEVGKLGGNPDLLKQKPTKGVIQIHEDEIEYEGAIGSSGKGDRGKPDVATLARVALHFLNEKTGRTFRETESNLSPIIARLEGVSLDIEGVKMMLIRQIELWKGDPEMDEHLCPATLFRKSKFDKYYDNRFLPVPALKRAGQPEANQLQEKIDVKLL